VDHLQCVLAEARHHDAGDDFAFAVELGEAPPLVGDEFDARDVSDAHRRAILGLQGQLRDVGGVDDAVRVAEKIREALEEPIVVAGNVLGISASIGIALYPEHGEEANEIAKRADDAMYWAKDSGRNRVVVFDPLLAPREPGAAG
jgi:GGDEF domain-containing protein